MVNFTHIACANVALSCFLPTAHVVRKHVSFNLYDNARAGGLESLQACQIYLHVSVPYVPSSVSCTMYAD